MAKKHNLFSGKMLPCPDPERYIEVTTKEGVYWRLKRGLGEKGAVLNEPFAGQKELTKIVSPAASLVVHTLRPFLHKLVCGRITVRIGTLLRQGLTAKGVVDWSSFKGFDLQKEYPMSKLLLCQPLVKRSGNSIGILLPATKGSAIALHNKLVDGYYFTALLLMGDPLTGGPLLTKSISSDVYDPIAPVTECGLWLELPEAGPWLLFLKVSCLEEGKEAYHPKQYGMKVVGFWDNLMMLLLPLAYNIPALWQ